MDFRTWWKQNNNRVWAVIPGSPIGTQIMQLFEEVYLAGINNVTNSDNKEDVG